MSPQFRQPGIRNKKEGPRKFRKEFEKKVEKRKKAEKETEQEGFGGRLPAAIYQRGSGGARRA